MEAILSSPFNDFTETSITLRPSGISTGTARRDLLSLISFLVKWINSSRAASDSVSLT